MVIQRQNDPEKTAEDGSPIRIVRRAETNLGDLCADAMRDQGQADIGFMNGGGVRVDVNAKGDITLGNIPEGTSLRKQHDGD